MGTTRKAISPQLSQSARLFASATFFTSLSLTILCLHQSICLLYPSLLCASIFSLADCYLTGPCHQTSSLQSTSQPHQATPRPRFSVTPSITSNCKLGLSIHTLRPHFRSSALTSTIAKTLSPSLSYPHGPSTPSQFAFSRLSHDGTSLQLQLF